MLGRLCESGVGILCDEVRVEGLPLEQAQHVIRDLRTLGTARALARLASIWQGGGALAEDAAKALELLGVMPVEVLRAVAGAWKKNRDTDILNRLFDVYVSRLKSAPR